MSRLPRICKCTRCKSPHVESNRISVPSKSIPGMEELVCPKCNCRSFFDITLSVAWAWASGLIEIGDNPVPDGPIKIAEGPMYYLELKVGVAARHGQGNSAGNLLVPGIPEAETEQAKGDALAKWLEWCAKGNGKQHSNGVVFMTAERAAHEEL